jgi:hypothetical protein
MKNKRLLGTVLICLYFWYYFITYKEYHFIDWANLSFHEAGHAIFFFFGDLFTVFAGSGFQVALPILINIYFFLHDQKVSSSICILWTGQNLLNVSVYVGDAIKMQLDLVGGDGTIHDWSYILSNLGILKYTSTVASAIYFLGFLTLIIGTFLSLYFASKEN